MPSPPKPPSFSVLTGGKADETLVSRPAQLPPDTPLSKAEVEIERMRRQLEEKDATIQRLTNPDGGWLPGMGAPTPIPPAPRSPTRVQAEAVHDYGDQGPRSIAARAGQLTKDRPVLVTLLMTLFGNASVGTAIVAYLNSRPKPADSGKEAYGQLAPAFEKFTGKQIEWNEKTSGQINFLFGTLEASGYKFRAPERGGPTEPTPKIEIKPNEAKPGTVAPGVLASKKGAPAKAVRVDVVTEPPQTPEPPSAIRLPEELGGKKPDGG